MTEPKIYEGKAIDGPLHGKWITARGGTYLVGLLPFAWPIVYRLHSDGIFRLNSEDQVTFVNWKMLGHTEYTEPDRL